MTKFTSVDLDEDRLLPDVRLRSDRWQKWRRSVLWVAVSVIALSTQSFGFFTGVCAFEESTKEILPEARLKLYDDSGRNAKVLLKKL